jgi:hypothetical protein
MTRLARERPAKPRSHDRRSRARKFRYGTFRLCLVSSTGRVLPGYSPQPHPEAAIVKPRVALVASSLGAVALAAASAVGIAGRRWRDDTQQLVDRLTHGAVGADAATVSFAELEGLPKPVQRYFRRAIIEGLPCIETARIVQTGTFNLGRNGDDWHTYDATQTYRVRSPGYVWDARIHLGPFADVRVRDAYVAQRGTMRGTFLPFVDLVNENDTHELNEGALQRYLAEAVMFPTALLPSQGVSWAPIDETHAWATIVDGDATARLQFEFANTGEVAAVSTPSRYRTKDHRYVSTPWGGRFRRYETAYAMRVPSEAEVFWVIDGTPRRYLTLSVRSFRYGFARATSAPANGVSVGASEPR